MTVWMFVRCRENPGGGELWNPRGHSLTRTRHPSSGGSVFVSRNHNLMMADKRRRRGVMWANEGFRLRFTPGPAPSGSVSPHPVFRERPIAMERACLRQPSASAARPRRWWGWLFWAYLPTTNPAGSERVLAVRGSHMEPNDRGTSRAFESRGGEDGKRPERRRLSHPSGVYRQ